MKLYGNMICGVKVCPSFPHKRSRSWLCYFSHVSQPSFYENMSNQQESKRQLPGLRKTSVFDVFINLQVFFVCRQQPITSPSREVDSHGCIVMATSRSSGATHQQPGMQELIFFVGEFRRTNIAHCPSQTRSLATSCKSFVVDNWA